MDFLASWDRIDEGDTELFICLCCGRSFRRWGLAHEALVDEGDDPEAHRQRADTYRRSLLTGGLDPDVWGDAFEAG